MKIWNKKQVKNSIGLLSTDNNLYAQVERNVLHYPKKDLSLLQPDKPIISLKNVSKFFASFENGKPVKFYSLKNISTSINQGEVMFLMGANGSGKSTLINCLCNIYHPSSGFFEYNYEFKHNPCEKFGVAFQINKYIDVLSVWDYIVFTQRLYKINTDIANVAFLLKLFGVDQYLDKKAVKLSGGLQQRLNLVLAILSGAKILIFDEITNNLDQKSRTLIIDFIKKYIRINNITTIIVSHDSLEVQKLATRILILNKGEVVYDDTYKKAIAKFKSIHRLIDRWK
ncbi:MAG: ABC transporter ATP-binding protein [Mycoplasmataceae bacterium]|nr:ABC transporter ATP-binding protein [Mycoplasmataceae bacterium]